MVLAIPTLEAPTLQCRGSISSNTSSNARRFITACEAVGLEIAVRAWWRGTPGHCSTRRKENAWLRTTVSGGLRSGALIRLKRSGIPDCVVEGGIEFGQFLSRDQEVSEIWSKCRSNWGGSEGGEMDFVPQAVKHVFQRFDVHLPSGGLHWNKRDHSPTIIFAPRTLSATPTTTPRAIHFSALDFTLRQDSPSASCTLQQQVPKRPSTAGPMTQRLTCGGNSIQFVKEERYQPVNKHGSILPTDPKPVHRALAHADQPLASHLEAALCTPVPVQGEEKECQAHVNTTPTRAWVLKKHLQEDFNKWFSGLRQVVKEGQDSKQGNKSPKLTRNRTRSKSKAIHDPAEVRRVFEFFDKDHSGFIEPHEFLPLLSKLLRKPKSEINMVEVLRSWDAVDTDGSGQLNFATFQSWYCMNFGNDPNGHVFEDQQQIYDVAMKLNMNIVHVRKLWAEFKKLDCDSTGDLGYDEFKVLIKQELHLMSDVDSNTKIMPEFFEELWNDVDTDKSGAVTFEEFAHWYSKRTHKNS